MIRAGSGTSLKDRDGPRAPRAHRLAVLAGLLALLAGCTLPPLPDEREVPVIRPLPAPEMPRPVPPLPDPGLPPPEPPPEPLWPMLSAPSATLLAESRRHQVSGNFVQAAISVERALRLDPHQPLLWLELGEIHLAEGDFVQAESMASKALSYAGPYRGVQQRAEALLAEARRSVGGR